MMAKVVAVVTLASASIHGFRMPRQAAGRNCGSRGRSVAELEGPNASIVNGRPASQCDWIWQASLEDGDGTFCGGMLIDEKWVLTAAHCLGGKIDVCLGKYKTTKCEGQKIRVKKATKHPDYDKRVEDDYDIALLELQSPANMGSCVGTVCLPEQGKDVPPGTSCWITGWGTLKDDGKDPNELQEGQVQTMTNRQCDDAPEYKGEDWITDSMICAQGRSGGKIVDACQGDSGGPMVCQQGGAWRVYGATSWGSGCADKDAPGVYARVHKVLSWIEGVMGGGGSPHPGPSPPPPPSGGRRRRRS